MIRLEELALDALVHGVLPDRPVRVIATRAHGSDAVTLTYKDDTTGKLGEEVVFRSDEPRLRVEEAAGSWSMGGDAALFRLVSEARRISLAHLFDPYLAVQTSNLEPLPHQIDAVYNKMLPQQPLRFLLADDPGAGKTIMAGLFIKELMIRGDVERCLVIAPGSLVEQWQDELWEKFGLNFEILRRDMIEASRSGNPFQEQSLLIARLDHLARRDDLQAKLQATDWDLVVVDEAHKMSAHFGNGDVKETKRYKIGRLAGEVARHRLFMTATPHAGIPEDFQLFLALLDRDRFEGKPGRGNLRPNTSDMMRRLVKEKLLRFDGTRLFPERRAYSPTYTLSEKERELYERVTTYVREEMVNVARLKETGEGRRGAVVGFALTGLQRRLASSPEAIYQSISRRKKRLQERIAKELEEHRNEGAKRTNDLLSSEELPEEFGDPDDEFDVDDLSDAEVENLEERVIDEASAARTIAELNREISVLEGLEEAAHRVRVSGEDRKWDELRSIIQDRPEMFDSSGNRRKLIIFTEHRDTLNYLVTKLRALLGSDETVVRIHGGMSRSDRKSEQQAFTVDKDVLILVATDAAGEGINLQRAHLVINYDLPWNPNRIEQRFGRVHRIGQTEMCHLWNLVAADTREAEVFLRLFLKLEEQRKELGDQVFDVLGEAFSDTKLRDLLIEAITEGESDAMRQRLTEVVDATVGERLRDVINKRMMLDDVLTKGDVEEIRQAMERAEARKVQPHFIRSFFLHAFELLGGTIREREVGRFQITRVPPQLRQGNSRAAIGRQVQRNYERVVFEREQINAPGKPLADFLTPGHPLLDATINAVVGEHESLLREGAILIDDSDPGMVPRTLVYLQHEVRDGRTDSAGNHRLVSKRFEYVEIDPDGRSWAAGWAPYLDYRPSAADEAALLSEIAANEWIPENLESRAIDRGVELAKSHLDEVSQRVTARVERTTKAVEERLQSQITYWDKQANRWKERELAGTLPRSGMSSAKARQRADELEMRLKRRREELDLEGRLSSPSPVVVGGALVIPAGLLNRLAGAPEDQVTQFALDRDAVERAAVDAVLATEKRLSRVAKEMERNNKGYDIESIDETGVIWFIEVKGRIAGADTFTVTRSEIGVGKNKPDQHVLALVEVGENGDTKVRYVHRAFDGVEDRPFDDYISVVFPWKPYFERGMVPA